MYVDAAFTKARVPTLHRDTAFKSTLDGNVYAQVLFVDGGATGNDRLFAVTESNNVYALDAATGSVVWKKNVGVPAPDAILPCGNIDPVGITGTPIIDLPSRTIFFDAVTASSITDAGAIVKHLVYGLSIDNGSVRRGFPVDLSAKVSYAGTAFDSLIQEQRGALAIWNGVLYVPFSGHGGDCQHYHGWLIGVPLANPKSPKGWATEALRGGSWGVSGVASDESGLYITTGNTTGATTWGGGEALIHFAAGPTFSGKTADYFAPSNWPSLDKRDQDLGGTGPVLFSMPNSRPSQLAVALGKNGVIYLLDRGNLGGVGSGDGGAGEGVFSEHLSNSVIITAAVAYHTKTATYIAARANGIGCPGASTTTAFKVTPGSPPSLSVAWCANQFGRGSPIVTTPDGTSDAVVWGLGAERTPVMVTAFDGDTGAVLLDGSNAANSLASIRRFIAPIVAKGRYYVAGDGAAYAFSLGN